MQRLGETEKLSKRQRERLAQAEANTRGVRRANLIVSAIFFFVWLAAWFGPGL